MIKYLLTACLLTGVVHAQHKIVTGVVKKDSAVAPRGTVFAPGGKPLPSIRDTTGKSTASYTNRANAWIWLYNKPAKKPVKIKAGQLLATPQVGAVEKDAAGRVWYTGILPQIDTSALLTAYTTALNSRTTIITMVDSIYSVSAYSVGGVGTTDTCGFCSCVDGYKRPHSDEVAQWGILHKICGSDAFGGGYQAFEYYNRTGKILPSKIHRPKP